MQFGLNVRVLDFQPWLYRVSGSIPCGMVVVPKPEGKVKICVDLTKLNSNVCRERHILPSVESTLAQLRGAKYFSKLEEANFFIFFEDKIFTENVLSPVTS